MNTESELVQPSNQITNYANSEEQDTYVFPLRETKFEGVSAKIPYRYEDMLVSEYGRRAVTQKAFAGWVDTVLTNTKLSTNGSIVIFSMRGLWNGFPRRKKKRMNNNWIFCFLGFSCVLAAALLFWFMVFTTDGRGITCIHLVWILYV